MIELYLFILVAIGLACVVIPDRFGYAIKVIALTGAGWLGFCGVRIFAYHPVSVTGYFSAGPLAGFFTLAAGFFSIATIIYSMSYANRYESLNRYCGYILWSAVFAIGAFCARHLVVFTVMWGLSGVMLYLLASLQPGAANAAKKSFILIGASDVLLLFGALILGLQTGSFEIGAIRVNLSHASALSQGACASFLIAALTKAGAMPFHTWVPDFAEATPLSLSAFLPGALDKLLGIFLLLLVTCAMFTLTPAFTIALLLIGAVTIVAAVSMAMVQHDMRRLLSYHAVSQVGYMVIGIAIGTPLGIIAGVFHMLNHALYKSALFFAAGAVETATGTTHLERLGGLAARLPITAAVCCVAALAISGIPPLNGFMSKWMIYQSLLTASFARGTDGVVAIVLLLALVAALVGSAFTLASFIKLLHAVFFGQSSDSQRFLRAQEVGGSMLAPMLVLAGLCIAGGVMPSLPVNALIAPAVDGICTTSVPVMPRWDAGAALVLLATGAALGILLSVVSGIRFRRSRTFVGGEQLDESARAMAVDFYRTISELPACSWVFDKARRKWFDLYDLSITVVHAAGRALSAVQTGSTHTYALLMLLGMVLVYAVLL